jgi:hypothetical protein
MRNLTFATTVVAAMALGIAIEKLVVALAIAQPAGGSVNLPSPLTGQEIVSVLPLQANGQPGAVIANVRIAQIAAFAANSTVSTTASGTLTMTTPTLILSAPLTGGLLVTLPAMPVNGQVAVIVNGSGAAFNQVITTGVPNGVIPNLPAGGSARFQYNGTTMMWARIG